MAEPNSAASENPTGGAHNTADPTTTAEARQSQEKNLEHAEHNVEVASAAGTANVVETKERDESPAKVSETSSDHDGAEQGTAKKGNAAPPEETRSKSTTVLIMAALMMATFLAALDMTIVTTALPTIATDFQVSNADYSWVGSAYLLGAAAGTPTWGKISDTFGRKPSILVANVIFLVGSLICGLSINIHMLLAGRAIQGVGGGGLLILTNICITDLFSMRSRGMYYGLIGMVWAFASAIGPVLGGVFTEYVTWRWCFYINLPCDGAAFILLILFLKIHNPHTPLVAGIKAIDWAGTITVIGGTIMFLMGLEYGGVTYPWDSAIVICLIVFGIVTLGIFFVMERYVAIYPLMPLNIFASRNSVAALGVALFHGFSFISASYFIPIYFQTVLGASPLLSGVWTFPFVLALSFASALTGVFIRKTGLYREPIIFGTLLLTIGFGLYINFPAYESWPRIIMFQIIAGVGAGPNFQAPLIALQAGLQQRDVAAATATFGFVRNLGTSMSVVLGGVIFQNELQKHTSAFQGLPANVSAQLSSGSAGSSTGLIQSLPDAQKQPILDAYTSSLSMMWIFYAVTSFLAFACSLLIQKKQLSKQHEKVETGLQAQKLGREEREAQRRSKQISREPAKDVEKASAAADKPTTVEPASK